MDSTVCNCTVSMLLSEKKEKTAELYHHTPNRIASVFLIVQVCGAFLNTLFYMSVF